MMADCGAPFKWKKQRGGLVTEWVGICIDYRHYKLGLSEEEIRMGSQVDPGPARTGHQ